MTASQLIEALKLGIAKHGDLDVFMLTQENLWDVELTHSTTDWAPSFFSGQTWEDRGLQSAFILDRVDMII
jgi:hypothetical protein